MVLDVSPADDLNKVHQDELPCQQATHVHVLHAGDVGQVLGQASPAQPQDRVQTCLECQGPQARHAACMTGNCVEHADLATCMLYPAMVQSPDAHHHVAEQHAGPLWPRICKDMQA